MDSKGKNWVPPARQELWGDRLKRLRDALGYPNAKEFAEEVCGIPYGTYAGYESKRRHVGIEHADVKIASATGVNYMWLHTGKEKEFDPDLIADLLKLDKTCEPMIPALAGCNH